MRAVAQCQSRIGLAAAFVLAPLTLGNPRRVADLQAHARPIAQAPARGPRRPVGCARPTTRVLVVLCGPLAGGSAPFAFFFLFLPSEDSHEIFFYFFPAEHFSFLEVRLDSTEIIFIFFPMELFSTDYFFLIKYFFIYNRIIYFLMKLSFSNGIFCPAEYFCWSKIMEG